MRRDVIYINGEQEWQAGTRPRQAEREVGYSSAGVDLLRQGLFVNHGPARPAGRCRLALWVFYYIVFKLLADSSSDLRSRRLSDRSEYNKRREHTTA